MLQAYRLNELPSESARTKSYRTSEVHLASLSVNTAVDEHFKHVLSVLAEQRRHQFVSPVPKSHPGMLWHDRVETNQNKIMYEHAKRVHGASLPVETNTASHTHNNIMYEHAKRVHGASLPVEKTGAPHTLNKLSQHLARSATSVAGEIGTVGNCALGPRLTFDKLGYHLPPVVATEQGRIIEQSGLFHEVSRSEVRPGDYAYRHWSQHIIRQHGGVDKGDSFIVAQVGRSGELYGANDHTFAVPEDGDRYADTKYFRPNEQFLRVAKFA